MAKLVLVASTSLRAIDAAPHAILELGKLPPASWVYLRKPTKKPARSFELAVAIAASNMDINVRWWMPGPGGRQATFVRDVEMVAAADEVVAYFNEEEVMSEKSGTAHVMEKALDQGKPCRAYSIVDGALKWVGGYNPEGQT